MSPFINKIRSSFSEINPKDLIYLGIVLLFMIVVSVIFILSTEFIAKNIDTAFSGDTGERSSTLNMENYTLVAKKLGISTEIKEETIIVPVVTTPSEQPTNTSTQVLEKEELTLNILNSTPKSGVAGTLGKTLESVGYAKAVTGNVKPLYATTTIIIKESKSAFGPALLEEVQKSYPNAVLNTTSDTAQYDIKIIIGSK